MSPDIEWRVKDTSSEQALAKTPSTPAARWRASLVVLMIVLGAGLGLAYSSIKEPAPQLTPTALPTVMPTTVLPSVFDTIDREAQALADGDFKTFISTLDQSNPVWYQLQVQNFRAWGQPPINVVLFNYKSSLESLSLDLSVIDIAQYRYKRYFRETRFYRLLNGQWLRTRPDESFWNGQYQKSRSQHFSIIYPVEDSGLISTTIDRFEWTYNQVCADLDCPSSLAVTQLNIKPFIVSPHWSGLNGSYTIVIPSPRITGYYDISGAIMNWELLDDPIGQSTFDTLMPMLTQRLSGGGERWTQSSQGTFFLQAIETWELNRLSVYPNMMPLLPPKQLSNNIPLIKLESLWTLQSTPSNPEQVANSVIFFIEQKYGVDSVSKFLKAIGPAQSFKQVIKNSLGLDEIQFEQQWQDWLKQLYAQGS